MISRLPRSVAIIGAGPAGLFAARRLKQLGVEKITLLEKNEKVGGKCDTYTDPKHPGLKTERGATAITLNYGVVLDAVAEKNIKTEQFLPTEAETVEIANKISQMRFGEKIKFSAQMCFELIWRYNKLVHSYYHARNHLHPLPKDFELPFAVYAKNYGLENINLFLKPFVAGFGYGAMDEIPTYCVLEYMGYLTLPTIAAAEKIFRKPALNGIHGGFQHLMEEVAKDFNVLTSVKIERVIRKDHGVSIHFVKDNENQILDAETLVLAISPMHWPSLGMALTETEQECVDNLNFYRYPIAVCHIKSLSANHFFVPEALEKNGFGHVAFLSTRDNRDNPEDGRLCTVYINLPQGKNDFSAEDVRKVILQDFKQKFGIAESDIIIDEVKIWEDYSPSLPWEIRLKLEKEQNSEETKTIHAGAHTLGSFDSVACVTKRTTEIIDQCYQSAPSYLENCKNELKRMYHFFSRPHEKAVDHHDEVPQLK